MARHFMFWMYTKLLVIKPIFMDKTFRTIIIALLATAAIIAGIIIASDDSEPIAPEGFLDEEVSAAPNTADLLEGVEYEGSAVFDLNFAHTAPGEFSEIFVFGSGFTPGEKTIVYLKKTGSDEYEPGGHEVFVDKDGYINTKFRVFNYGSYDVEMFYSSEGNFVKTIVVE